jgi:regulator of sigma E protease
MTIVKIILGLLGLGIVVFFHELGHFIAARATGIEVEAFAIGWGKTIVKKKIGKVEYRLALFPIGGYCKMKGDDEYQEAMNNKTEIKQTPGTFYGAAPWRRIIVSFAGPFANIIFAVIVFIFMWGIGFDVHTLGNKIILVSDYETGTSYPANAAGLKTGDEIIEVDGKSVQYSTDIQMIIATNAEKEMNMKVNRNGEIIELSVIPSLDKATGAGLVGFYFWTDPVIGSVLSGSAAEQAGLIFGDKIISINEISTPHTTAISKIIEAKPESLNIEYERNGNIAQTEIALTYDETGLMTKLGIGFQVITYRTPNLHPMQAIAKGSAEMWKTLVISVKSLGLLFRDIDLTQAVSGPVRITFMLGDVAAEGFGESFALGIRTMANFLALISISLCIMNLLPIPIVDGGMIVLFIIEWIRRKPLNSKVIHVFQTVGVVIIFSLMAFALFGDILFLAGSK